MSIKVYVHYNEEEHPEKTSKLSIPGSWASKSVSDVINLFIKPYNDKNPDHILVLEEVHLENEQNQGVYSNIAVSDGLVDRGEYKIKHGPFVKTDKPVKAAETRPRCRNYGCNKHFHENENDEESCLHHSMPPVFHDTAKYWSCCKDKKAYDFDSFQAIAGCCRGRHSTVDPALALGASPNTRVNSASAEEPKPVLKSIDDFNANNSDAVSAADSAVKTLLSRKSTRKDDGTARCQRKGCQKVFEFNNNSDPNACQYHKGQAIFHDAVKFWSCCPQKKCYDFDEFLAVPGCAYGLHDDGVVELEE